MEEAPPMGVDGASMQKQTRRSPMASLPGCTAAGKRRSSRPSRTATAPQHATTPAVDHREQLYNDGEIGTIQQVSRPESMITSLRGILLDIDPGRLRKSVAAPDVLAHPDKLYKQVVREMLARDPVLNKAEVRVSGRGLHAILRFSPAIELPTEGERQRWAAIVKVIQRLLPTDPDCPGITALTRPLGSVNSKNGAIVRQLLAGESVTAEEVIGLFERVRTSPFQTVAALLFGSGRIQPCPVCNKTDSRLDVLSAIGKCYGCCGKVRLAQLYDVFLEPRSARKEA
jgi:hypothetical protein